jgi:hypothetical protein
MTLLDPWWAVSATIAVLALYEACLVWTQRRHPERLARSVHAGLREQWFEAISLHPGSEILAVQTLRNSLMSASMVASTAAIGLVGSATLAAPSLHLGPEGAGPAMSPRLALDLVLMALLFASMVASAMAVRYFNHAGFIASMPVGSDARRRWSAAGVAYLRRAGLLYGWGLRQLLLIAPILAAIVHPLAGPVAALLVVVVLVLFDRASTSTA